ncbi:MAG: helix-turn-helix domain-containing protein [Deltaproteobacteria bacterium]|nr:helix-turn-helix domain-containing protein [Deltaproteobacteria bacterium]
MADRMDNKEILTIEEAAEYLSLGKRSIYKLIKTKKIPHKKILNKFRFLKAELRDWVGNVK